ncbi:MAG: radical SAM protein [Planctomycetes bacterium]|nr:radical SAM protein [Planctomycetota bacterium]
MALNFWGRERPVYANANLSIYSGQTCNARCAFCVEELRPASRGGALAQQRTVEPDDETYFSSLEESLRVLRHLNPSVSVTGGEPSLDPRLPRILRTIAAAGARKRTITTNGSGLLDIREGKTVLDWISECGLAHLNLSRAHPDEERNNQQMGFRRSLPREELGGIVQRARRAGVRVRLSCILVKEGVSDLEGIERYLEFARSVGVDNVIFRGLMQPDARTADLQNSVVRYSAAHRVALDPILTEISRHSGFGFRKQITGYYYYVEVWRHRGVDVVFEEADLAQLEAEKRAHPEVIHELIFHPNAKLASTWQPWDGVLGPSVPKSAPTA